jgi:hypothetical protein
LLASIGNDELMEWMAVYNIEPWGEARADARALYAGQMSVWPHVKDGEAVKAKDFFPHLFQERREQTPEEQAAILASYARMHGQKVE